MYWISVKTGWRDDADYMGCSRSARLTFHELVFLCGRKETATLNMNDKQIAAMLGISISEAQSDITELLDAGLIERTTEDQIFIPAIADEINKFLESRNATKERVDKWRKNKATTKASNSDVTRYNDVTNADGVTRYERTSKVKLSKVKDDGEIAKNSSEQKPAAAAAESEFVKLWREWTIHTGPIAPTFKARIDETVTDLEVWRDTLTFGAKIRRVKHTNNGLDWALANYKTGIAQKRAAGMQTNGHAPLTTMPKRKIMVEGVEVYI